MLIFSCKGCKHLAWKGYKNELDEYFCSLSCYEKYCKKNNYKSQLSNLKEVNGRRYNS